ncbi:MAG: hypothetical protein OXK21_08305, partial [Chloroflexota bacterium]|nr:hypothetical protein [Chloroflexota bacterium]
PILGGTLADYFLARSLTFNLVWSSPNGVLSLPAVSLGGYEFLFVIVFFAGLLTLNMLVALREEGEATRDVALGELLAGATPAVRLVRSLPLIGPASAFSYANLKRVPGADVAMGVAAYQLAASTQAAVESVTRGQVLTRDVARAVHGALREATEGMEDIADQGLELARHAARGAVYATRTIAGRSGVVARGAVLGTLRALASARVSPLDALRGAGYGAVQGAVEAGEDPVVAAQQAIEAAREAAVELGVPPVEAIDTVAGGALEAARAEGGEAFAAVQDALAYPPE